MAFRVLFAVATYYNLDINQMNVKTAFLYGLIDELVYIQVPKGSKTQVTKEIICKLLKILYSLKQALKSWYKRLSKFFLEKLKLQQINTDHSIFISSAEINRPIISIFIDNIKIIGVKNSEVIMRVKQKLTSTFEIANMRLISFYLGFKVTRD